MEMCQGTFNYIFSPLSLLPFEELGFVFTQEPSTPCLHIKNMWLQTAGKPFCVQFREIHNEELFQLETPKNDIKSLAPGFFSFQSDPQKILLSPYTLESFVIESSASIEMPFKDLADKIIWAEARQGTLYHQLWYRKKFPFWALLIRPTTNLPALQSRPQTYLNAQEIFWLQSETTSWDFLIDEAPLFGYPSAFRQPSLL